MRVVLQLVSRVVKRGAMLLGVAGLRCHRSRSLGLCPIALHHGCFKVREWAGLIDKRQTGGGT